MLEGRDLERLSFWSEFRSLSTRVGMALEGVVVVGKPDRLLYCILDGNAIGGW